MGNIFLDIQNALASITGLDTTVAGFLLGTVLIGAMLFILLLIFRDEGNSVFILAAGVGVLIAGVVGWYPLWSIVFIAIVIVFIWIDPLGDREAA
jgi:hypothetical protein